MRPVAVIAAAFVALIGLAGCGPDSASFQANNVNVAMGSDGVARNDEIGIAFSEPLDTASVSVEALRVTDADGRRLVIRARAAHDTIYVSPLDPDGWPSRSRVTIEVPHPWLGRPIRSASGAANEASFKTTVATSARYATRGGTLSLVYHSLPFSDGTDVTEEAEFLFELDAPIDARSLAAGVTLDDLTHGETAPHFAARLVTPRRLSVVPFDANPFRSGTRYRLTLTGALRGEDARRLGEPARFTFTTTRSRSGEFTTDFRAEHLVDPSLKPDSGPLTPLLATSEVPIGVGLSHGNAAPFGRDRARVQILVPSEMLVNEEGVLENTLITAMSFRVFGAAPATMRLSARLDYASDRVGQTGQLGREFEANWDLPATRQRDFIGAEGAIHALDGSEGLLTFAFAKPFFYEAARRRAVLLEIVNESGILNESAGIELRGETLSASSPHRFVEARGDFIGEGQTLAFVPAMSLSMQRPRPVPLVPWRTNAVADPEYFRRQDLFMATPGFVSFQVEYRSFDGAGDPASTDGYGPDAGALDGQRAIQARIVFTLRSADPLPKDAGLLRLTVPFRERGAE